MLSGFELYSRWVPLSVYSVLVKNNYHHKGVLCFGSLPYSLSLLLRGVVFCIEIKEAAWHFGS